MDFLRKPNESEEEFIWRIGQAKDNGTFEASWEEIAEIINRQFRLSPAEYYASSAYRKAYQYAKRFFEAGVFNDITQENYFEKINAAKYDLEREREKTRVEKNELARWNREQARDEMILEKISEAIKTLPPMQEHKKERPAKQKSEKTYLLCFGDCHYGIEFELKDLKGDAINAYSPAIFESRMEYLKSKVIETIKKEHVEKLNIFEMGDSIQGILRLNSQLLKLRYGIIDSAIRYAEYLAEWLNDLSRYVEIDFQMVEDSNHNQLRICGAPKNAFAEENLSKVIENFIDLRLEKNDRVNVIHNPTGFNFLSIPPYNILGIHGEVNNLERAINEVSRAYDEDIDYLIAGHVHHKTQKEVGINSEVLNIGSVIGVDPYTLSIHKTSSPSASLFIFDEKDGKVCEYTYKLNN